MKTIYRQLFFGAILAVVAAGGSLTVNAQTATDPCDAATTTAATEAYTEWTGLFEKKDLPNRKLAIEKGKQLVAHAMYPKCEATKAGIEFVASSLPGMERAVIAIEAKNDENARKKRFLDGIAASNWEDVYSAGKELVTKYVDVDMKVGADSPEQIARNQKRADDYRPIKLVLGTIGLDETGKTPSVTKWNDDTIKYARAAIADIEAGKSFTTWGVGKFVYKNKEEALGYMNYNIGYILSADKKDRKGAADYMYKASQSPSGSKNEPVTYSVIASYYVIDLNKNIEELKALPGPVDADTPEVKQQKVDAIKDKTGMVNGAAERVMDAYARAYNFAPNTPAGKAYRDSLRTSFKQIYDIRFQKPDATVPTVDAWMASVSSKTFLNPSTPITPVLDAEKAPSTTTAAPGPGTPVTVKPTAPTNNVKPATTPVKPAGPGTKPAAAGTKPAVAAVKKKTNK
jgi:hypothetical protein